MTDLEVRVRRLELEVMTLITILRNRHKGQYNSVAGLQDQVSANESLIQQMDNEINKLIEENPTP